MRDAGSNKVFSREYVFESDDVTVLVAGKNPVGVNIDLCRYHSRREGLYLDMGHGLVRDVQLRFPYSDSESCQERPGSGFDVTFDARQFLTSSRENYFLIPLMSVSRSLDGSRMTLNGNSYVFRDATVVESLKRAYDYLGVFLDMESGISCRVKSRVSERVYAVSIEFPEFKVIPDYDDSLERRLA